MDRFNPNRNNEFFKTPFEILKNKQLAIKN